MKGWSYTSTPPMCRTACTEPQCLYRGALYFLIYAKNNGYSTGRRVHIVCWVTGATDTHSEYVILIFLTATMVTRTRFIFTFTRTLRNVCNRIIAGSWIKKTRQLNTKRITKQFRRCLFKSENWAITRNTLYIIYTRCFKRILRYFMFCWPASLYNLVNKCN